MRILLAEDNIDNRRLIQIFLAAGQHELTTAENGVEALQAFKEGEFDLVLMDVQMPKMGGLDATRAIREWEESHGKTPTPIVALTAHAGKENEKSSLDAGCTTHISKPIKRGEFLAAIQEYA